MAIMRNKDAVEALRNLTGLMTAEGIPQELQDKIQAVLVINPEKEIQVKDLTASDTVGANIMTTSATKRTFLTGVHLSVSKNIVSDSLFSRVNAIAKGKAAINVLKLLYEPLTAGTIHESVMFNPPIELEKSTLITMGNSTTTASIDINTTLYFYEVDED